MASNALNGFLEGLRRAAQRAESATDGELLHAFVARRDDLAFEALLRRHGPMVLGVCRRILRNEADAEDAFQATFLVLVKKAAGIRSGGLVGNWLYGVAHNTALKARALNGKRAAQEKEHAAAPPAQAAEEVWRQVQALLDEEVRRLPEKYRAPIVLCALAGKTIQEAARELGWPPGTLATRLARGRALLEKRLGTHGLALSGGVLAAGLTGGSAWAGVPPALLVSTLDAARLLAAGQAVQGIVPVAVAALTEGVMKQMSLTRFKVVVTALCLAASLLGTAAWGYTRLTSAAAPPAELPAPRPGGGAAKGNRDLEGEWRLIEIETDRKPVSRLRLLLVQRVFHFQGDRFRVTSQGQDSFAPGTRFELDASRDPRTIDLIVTRGGKTFTLLGIYAIEKGRLRLCVSFADPSKRPTKFEPDHSIGASVEVLERFVPKGRARAPAEEFAALLRDWGQADQARERAWSRARTPAERDKARADAAARVRQLAQRCLKVAEKDDGPVGLAALCRAAARSPGSAAGKKALALLEGGRIARADLADLAEIFDTLRWTPADHEAEAERFALAVLARVRRGLDHSDAAKLLCWVCTRSLHFRTAEPPRSFAGAAELIVERFAASPEIVHFCECLGSIGATPRIWARNYEKGLRTILMKNRTRRVRSPALFALARVVSTGGVARQPEAEELFRAYLKEFDGNDPRSGNIEKEYRARATREIAEIQARGLGKPAPEIEGIDLDGKPAKLSGYRGKVVLLSFWATWCFPCLKFVPHERALVKRLQGKPFAIVGVNSDQSVKVAQAAATKHEMTWRSFRDRRPSKPAISDEWKILGFPTLYLIDHKGIIQKRWIGAPTPEELNRAVDPLVEAASRKQ